MKRAIEILGEVNLSSVQPPKAIWNDASVVVEAVHRQQYEDVIRRRRQLKEGGPPKNIVLQGRPGAGKSHFLGRVRRETIGSGDFFVAVHLTQATEFWQALSLSYAEALFKPHSGVTQLQFLLDAVFRTCGLTEHEMLPLLAGEVRPGRLATFRTALKRTLGRSPEARTIADVAVALVLHNSDDGKHNDIAYSLFEGLPLDENEQESAGLNNRQLPPLEVVRGLDRLVAAAGKVTVTALDQLDGLIAVAHKAMAEGDVSELNVIANDLMQFAEIAEHTIAVVSCTKASWDLIRDEAIQAAKYRFPDVLHLAMLPSPDCGEALIREVLAREYGRLDFKPEYPTWPIKKSAFSESQDYTPRGLILAVDGHIAKCVRDQRVVELERLGEAEQLPEDGPLPTASSPRASSLADLDKRFAELKGAADTGQYFNTEDVERSLPPLLYSALASFVGENADENQLTLDEVPDPKSSVQARLREVLDAEREDEIHHSFRIIPQANAISQLSRLRGAVVASGLGRQRHLTIIRDLPWGKGKKTQAELEEFARRGGVTVALTQDDVGTFAALHRLLDEKPDGLSAWLRARRPASTTKLLGSISLAGARPASTASDADLERTASIVPPSSAGPIGKGPPVRAKSGAIEGSIPDGHITLGTSPETGRLLTVPLEDLRRHASLFAGSGSGKTVLLRRIIEECALQGVSSIVLDPNNDLARLGIAPREAPDGWLPGDDARAEIYVREVEAVVWTPRMSSGRPLSFAPLAGLSSVAGDGDDFEVALDSAVDLLTPRARLSMSTTKGSQGRAVLKNAVRSYVQSGNESLKGFFAFLTTLPDGVSDLENGQKFAAEMAETLKAEATNDPMFGDHGQAVDPAALLTPTQGKRARVSVISMIGLPNQEQQQQFVSQLQLALFSWIKKNPAGDRPLGGLFVMDEAQNYAPSGGATPSTGTTLALASQARKYGLGLLFATQAPKALHNRVPGNTATQFFGFLNASAQISAANELAASRGGRISDIAKLRPGEFYVASDGLAFQRVNTPFCLTYHPRSPLTQEEIMRLAATELIAA